MTWILSIMRYHPQQHKVSPVIVNGIVTEIVSPPIVKTTNLTKHLWENKIDT